MNIIRLGDRIESVQRPSSVARPYLTAQYIAQKVFNPAPDHTKVKNYYVQSQPISPTPPFIDDMPKGTKELGEYEVLLVDKLLHPQRPIVIIVGPMGSGKTTVKNYVGLHLVKNRQHCNNCQPPRQRMIAQIDFNEHAHLNDLTGKELTNKLFEILCDELLSRINHDSPVPDQDELQKFWNYELERFNNHQSSSASFRKIQSMMPGDLIARKELSDNEILQRKRVLNSIKREKDLHLDYLLRFWNFVNRTYYCGNHGCAFVILDNLDIVHPAVQRKIVDIVMSHTQREGPTFLLLVRPETFDKLGMGTGIMDVETHRGNKPSDIILVRLQEFCDKPEDYFEPSGGLTREQFEIVKRYALRVNQIIRSDHNQSFMKFVNQACGISIRPAFLIAQNIFNASIAEMNDENLHARDIVRICIRGNEPQLHWSPEIGIEHLFRVSTHEIGGLMVKSRILHYLGRTEKGIRRINEITTNMNIFGYEENIVVGAMNDMMQIKHQLLRSNGFDHYEEDALKKHISDRVLITDIGRGYINHLVHNIDYLQEVMLDTYVDGDHFPKSISYGYLIDKFRLIRLFVEELRRTDVEEMRCFLEREPEIAYFETFGHHIISLDIIQAIYQPATRILRSAGHDSYEYEELIDQFKSLALRVEADNKKLLGGEWAESVVRDDDKEGL
jgi:hypothetical protein